MFLLSEAFVVKFRSEALLLSTKIPYCGGDLTEAQNNGRLIPNRLVTHVLEIPESERERGRKVR